MELSAVWKHRLGALVISVPLYVYAAASVPIQAHPWSTVVCWVLALVFLMAGHATNVATIGAVRDALGGRITQIYLTTVILGSSFRLFVFDEGVDLVD